VTQQNNAGQSGEAKSGLSPQQPTSGHAGFSWSSAKLSTQPASQPSTAVGPTLSKFGWPSPTKVFPPPHLMTPPVNGTSYTRSSINGTSHTPSSAPSTTPPSIPSQPPQQSPTGLNSAATAASTVTPSYQHTHPSVYGHSPGPAIVNGSLLSRAKENDKQALTTLFGQFIPNHEQIIDTRYLGVLGMWGIGTHSFSAVTTQRIASIQVSILGHVQYQDGVLECINSSVLAQPSLLGLYLYAAAVSFQFGLVGFFAGILFGLAAGIMGAMLAILLSLLLLPFTVRLYYRLKKSGLVLWVREGIAIVVFIDRKRMGDAKRFYRLCCDQREERVRIIGQV
jgi:hypothetical protein